MGYKMTILTKKNSYTMFHPWRCDKTDYRLWNKTPSLCEAERKRFAVGFHQEDKGKALVHCLAENESVNKIYHCQTNSINTQLTLCGPNRVKWKMMMMITLAILDSGSRIISVK